MTLSLRSRLMYSAVALTVLMSGMTHAEAAEDYTMLEINGKKIAHSEVMSIWNEMFPAGSAPDFASVEDNVKQGLVRGVVGEQLISNQAIEAGFADKPQVQQQLERIKKKLLVQAFLDEKAASIVTPAAVKDEYDRMKSASGNELEVRASHILVKDKAAAEKIHAQLKNGADFDYLAKEKSTDKASAVSGGDLGYFTKDKMVAAFAEAAFALKKGEVSAPVESDFGWHIIKKVDERKKELAPFAEQRPVIEQQLKAKALSDYINSLVENAKINYFAPDGSALEFQQKIPQ
jgi:peptidyl-prolyl cis-trans isomerase C